MDREEGMETLRKGAWLSATPADFQRAVLSRCDWACLEAGAPIQFGGEERGELIGLARGIVELCKLQQARIGIAERSGGQYLQRVLYHQTARQRYGVGRQSVHCGVTQRALVGNRRLRPRSDFPLHSADRSPRSKSWHRDLIPEQGSTTAAPQSGCMKQQQESIFTSAFSVDISTPL